MINRKYTTRVAAGLCTAALLLSGCNGINDSATLINVNNGEGKITLGYGNFVARYTQATYDKYYLQYYGNDYWKGKFDEDDDETMEDTVKGDVIDTLEEQYASRAHAADYDIELSDEENEEIQEAAKQFLEDNDEEVLKEMGATEEYVVEMLTNDTYEELVKDAVREEKNKKLKDKDVVQNSFSYVELDSDSDDENPKTDEELRAAAERIAKADDFDAAVKEEGFEVETDYYTAAGTVDEIVEEEGYDKNVTKVFMGLTKEGEVSDAVETKGGGDFYVFRLDKLGDDDKTEEVRNDKLDEYYYDKLDEWVDETEWEVNEKQWAKVRFTAVFDSSTDEDADAADESTDETSDETTEDTETTDGEDTSAEEEVTDSDEGADGDEAATDDNEETADDDSASTDDEATDDTDSE